MLDTIFHYSQGLQKSRTVFSILEACPVVPAHRRCQICILSPCLWIYSRLCHYMAGKYLAVLPAISPKSHRGKEKGKVFKDRRLYLLSLSRLSTSNWSPYKWCFSLSHLIVAVCSGWNARSDNNMQFQLNSLMCDLYLKDCFLLQSEVLKTRHCFVRMYASLAWASHKNKFYIIWRCDTPVRSSVPTRYEIMKRLQIGLCRAFTVRKQPCSVCFPSAYGFCVEMSSLYFALLLFVLW